MCKVLIMPKINGPKAIEFAKLMGKEMSVGNTDGLGYAAVDKDGNLFGERWLKNTDAFTKTDVASKIETSEAIKALGDSIYGFTEYKVESNSFGEAPDISKAVSLTLHTRFATSAKGMVNTHPFVHEDKDSSLIHNGVIDNCAQFKMKVSTCDSEAILVSYLDQGVNLDTTKTQAMADELNGYYACGIFSRDAEGRRILDVFKGNTARLSVMYIKEFETYVFTTETSDANKVLEKMGIEKPDYYVLKEGQLLRFDPLSGKLNSKTVFTVPTRGWSQGHNTQTTTTNRGGTIVDASLSGNKHKNSMTNEMIALMKLTPKLTELSKAATLELIRKEYTDESFSA